MEINERVELELANTLQFPKQRTKMILFMKDTPAKMLAFLNEHAFLIDECEIHLNQEVEALDFHQGAMLIDRLYEIRYKSQVVDYEVLSKDLQTLVSACGCGLSDQW